MEKYKNSGEADKFYDYKLLEKEVKRLIKGAKNSFERKLTANISGNPKAFMHMLLVERLLHRLYPVF